MANEKDRYFDLESEKSALNAVPPLNRFSFFLTFSSYALPEDAVDLGGRAWPLCQNLGVAVKPLSVRFQLTPSIWHKKP